MAKKMAVREKVKKPKAVGWCEAWVDKTRLAGERRTVFIHLSSREAPHLRKIAEFCKQAADWMEDEQ